LFLTNVRETDTKRWMQLKDAITEIL
jgi:hypothetical protein